jgi:hypothetical protein
MGSNRCSLRPGGHPQTVRDHDCRFCCRWAPTWGFSWTLPVLNTTRFFLRRPDTDLPRRGATTGTWRWGRRVGTAAPSGRWWAGWSDRRVSRLAGLAPDGDGVQRLGQHGRDDQGDDHAHWLAGLLARRMGEGRVQISHGGSQGSNPLTSTLTYQQVKASSVRHRRRSRRSRDRLGPHWDHGRTADVAGPRCHRVPTGRCRRGRPGGHGAPSRPPGTGGRNGPG